MPRKPRFYLPVVPVHVVQRGNNRQAIFFDDSDYQVYIGWLKVSLAKYDCVLHTYVLMPQSGIFVSRSADYRFS